MTIEELKELKEEMYKYFTVEDLLATVKRNSWALQYVKEETRELCMVAVGKIISDFKIS